MRSARALQGGQHRYCCAVSTHGNLFVPDGVKKTARVQGQNAIELSVGFSHTVRFDAPEGVTFEVPQPTRIVVRGHDKQLVGQVAADIRKIRKPEPYKGKGIRYEGEYVQRKVGKRA